MSKKEVACYELTMPRVGSHNWKWSWEDRKYYCLLYGDMTRHKQLLQTWNTRWLTEPELGY